MSLPLLVGMKTTLHVRGPAMIGSRVSWAASLAREAVTLAPSVDGSSCVVSAIAPGVVEVTATTNTASHVFEIEAVDVEPGLLIVADVPIPVEPEPTPEPQPSVPVEEKSESAGDVVSGEVLEPAGDADSTDLLSSAST